MRPPERRETGEQDLFRSRLDQIIDLKHPLVALGRTMRQRTPVGSTSTKSRKPHGRSSGGSVLLYLDAIP